MNAAEEVSEFNNFFDITEKETDMSAIDRFLRNPIDSRVTDTNLFDQIENCSSKDRKNNGISKKDMHMIFDWNKKLAEISLKAGKRNTKTLLNHDPFMARNLKSACKNRKVTVEDIASQIPEKSIIVAPTQLKTKANYRKISGLLSPKGRLRSPAFNAFYH